ncbi:MAG: hypothetical protein RJB38_1162 [Pseudomonadota bacterium]|jgi:CBS domain-containing protein/uncharacterized protein (DUF2267 family)
MTYRSTIDPFIHRKITVLHQDDPASRAARAMRERGQGCVFVADHQGFLLGVVTDRDLACRVLAPATDTEESSELSAAETPLVRVMTPHPVSVGPQASLEEVVRVMEDNGIRRVPVVESDPQGRSTVVGLVTLDDLVAGEMIDSFRLGRIVRAQVRRRMGEFANQRGEVRSLIDGLGRVVTDDEVVNRFFLEIHLRSGLEKWGLKSSQTEGIARELLRTVIERLHYSGARHVLGHLPSKLQEQWEDLARGPDRRASLARLEGRIQVEGFCSAENCARAIAEIGRAWASFLSAEDLAVLRGQLPPEFGAILLPAESYERRLWAHAA